MSTGLISFMFGASVGAWVYNKVSHRTGHIVRTSVITSIFVGLVAMFVFYTLYNTYIAK
jgi:hypothetical protein